MAGLVIRGVSLNKDGEEVYGTPISTHENASSKYKSVAEFIVNANYDLLNEETSNFTERVIGDNVESEVDWANHLISKVVKLAADYGLYEMVFEHTMKVKFKVRSTHNSKEEAEAYARNCLNHYNLERLESVNGKEATLVSVKVS